ncbi:MAG: serine/threonine protein kinase [bacterium]|nr:serine/threonine protein kinase [bacterium]
MTEAERERRVVKLLSQALDLEGAARKQYLDGACAGDAELRTELDEMLGTQEELDDEGFLEVPAGAQLTSTKTLGAESVTTTQSAPQQLGPYRIVRPLGRGGMGTVYLGEQTQPVERRVALKIIDAVGDRRLLRRFAAECQALARLSHPNVASLYEVGATEDAHPFVAMELVEGTTITTYCDEKQLRLRARVELFFGVCAGIRHAHEKGVLHRDLKPSNVLVTEVDGRPTAKVIDFGIARALDKPLLMDTESMTLEHQIVGSPAYMSPEVASGDRDVDTRSDVYSLGLLLYQLLIGVLPFEIKGQSIVTVLRRLAKGDLPAASDRLAELDPERRERIAADRGLRDRSLPRRIRGDLDAIMSKAVARFREHRYSSPADLAADLERHLTKRPVEARAASYPYRLGRFMHRHLPFAVLIAALILALTAGIVARTGQARRANAEAERAMREAQRFGEEARRAREALAGTKEVSRFLVDLFEVADPERNRDEPLDVRSLLDRSAERLHDELQTQPLARAGFLQTIGVIYTKMALFDSAEQLIAEALEIRERELGGTHRDTLESVNQLGVILRRQGRLEAAEPLLRRVLAARQAMPNKDPSALAIAHNNLANLLWNQDRMDEAEAAHRRALEIRETQLGADHPDTAASLNNLGVMLKEQDRFDEADALLQRAAAIFAETLGSDHPRHGASQLNLGDVAEQQGRLRDAEVYLLRAVEVFRAAYGDEHERTRMALRSLNRVTAARATAGDEAAVP